MKIFQARIKLDKEFSDAVEMIYGELLSAGIAGKNKFRIIESMSEGISVGFIKAVILYKHEEENNKAEVKEFIVAPKYEDIGRDIEQFIWPGEITEKTVESWFESEGLIPPKIQFDTVEGREGEPQSRGDKYTLLRTAIEAMVYQWQYPYSEVNLGHPIDYDAQENILRRSSEAKQLGHYLREILIAHSIARYNGNTEKLAAPGAYPNIEEKIYSARFCFVIMKFLLLLLIENEGNCLRILMNLFGRLARKQLRK